jgi:hypothetical protein
MNANDDRMILRTIQTQLTILGNCRLFVVPKGIEHKPYAAQEVKLLLIEPRGVLNTGDAGGERTAQNDVWV